MSAAAKGQESILQSPWYWAYVFLAAAIAVLLIAQGKVQDRQAQIENKLQGRQRAVRQLSGQPADTPLSTPEQTRIQLAPLLATLVVLLILTTLGLSWQWSRRSGVQEREHEAETPAADERAGEEVAASPAAEPEVPKQAGGRRSGEGEADELAGG